MPELAAILEETLGAEGLVAASTDAAFGVEVLASSNDVPAGARLAAASTAGHIMTVALCAERLAVIVLEELSEREEALAAPVALEALLVEPLAEGKDGVALVEDVPITRSANHAGLLRAV